MLHIFGLFYAANTILYQSNVYKPGYVQDIKTFTPFVVIV